MFGAIAAQAAAPLGQAAERSSPPGAVHDTVAAVLRQPEFRRTMQSTLMQRILGWLWRWLGELADALGGLPNITTLLLWVAAIAAMAIGARLIVAARVRDPDAVSRIRASGQQRVADPWLVADALAAKGDYEGAAHALYRGVLLSLARTEQVRLDPSKTSGDYVRELRRRGSGARDAFRAFARRFDVAVYGHGGCDAALIADLRRLAEPLRARARAA